MKETFTKVNDYTLQQTLAEPVTEIRAYDTFQVYSRLTRTFNFLAAQVITTTRDMTFQSRGSSAGGSSSVSTQTTVQNFSDIQSDAEIRFMHKKLVSLQGHPPAIDDVLRGLGKKNSAPRTLGKA